MRLVAAGVVTGWGRGIQALPGDARAAAAGRAVVPLAPPAPRGERFRRATRECLHAVEAVEALLQDGGLGHEALRGDSTALVYATATAYAGANRAFIAAAGRALHFPYTAPSAVPAEVAIEFGVTGPYAIVLGEERAGQDALWHAGLLLRRGVCARALVLAVETLAECADLVARSRWRGPSPLVEAAAAVLLESGGDSAEPAPDGGEGELTARAGRLLACAPLVALAAARAREAAVRPTNAGAG